MIADVTGLDGISINAIGFGAASSLDGALLTQLSETHNGLYMRAGDGLDLKKYFALAFGNIFATGALLDPESSLTTSENAGKPIKFKVCGEKAITVVVGWDKAGSTLAINVKTPAARPSRPTTPGVEHATGRTWAFLRIRLPRGSERNGTWTATVKRAGGSGGGRALRYFVSVIAGGGAKARGRAGQGAIAISPATSIDPTVRLAGAPRNFPQAPRVRLTVTPPDRERPATLLMQGKSCAPPVTQERRHHPGAARDDAGAGKSRRQAADRRMPSTSSICRAMATPRARARTAGCCAAR